MKTYLNEVLEIIKINVSEYKERVTIYGFNGLQIEGHNGINEYDDQHVTVKIGKKELSVTGANLRINELSREEIYISGKIYSMGVTDAGKNQVHS